MIWEILIGVVTSGTAVGLLEFFRDRKEKKRQNHIESELAKYKAQSEGLDLVSKYHELVDTMQKKADQSAEKYRDERIAEWKEMRSEMKSIREDIISDMNNQMELHHLKTSDRIIARIDDLEGEIKNVVEYLNGDYAKWVKQKKTK